MSSISALSGSHHHHGTSASKSSLLSSGTAGAKPTPVTSTGAGASLTAGGISKLQKAVSDALQLVEKDGQTDPNKAIQSALTKIFQKDPSDSEGDNDDAAANATASTAGQSFNQILKSFGVTAGQFQADVKAALQKAGSTGKIDPATVFKSFAAGATLDTIG